MDPKDQNIPSPVTTTTAPNTGPPTRVQSPQVEETSAEVLQGKKSKMWVVIAVSLIIAVAVAAGAAYYFYYVNTIQKQSQNAAGPNSLAEQVKPVPPPSQTPEQELNAIDIPGIQEDFSAVDRDLQSLR